MTIFVTSCRQVIKMLGSDIRVLGLHNNYVAFTSSSNPLSPIVIKITNKPNKDGRRK